MEARMTSGSPRPLRLAGTVWQVQPGWEHVLFDQHGLRLAQWLAAGEASPVKEGAGRVVYRVDLAETQLYLKCYRLRGLRATSRTLLLRSPARREHRAACELIQRSVPTSVPLAWGERRTLGLASEHFFVTQAISGAITLADYVDNVLPRLAPQQQCRARREIPVALARFCAALHQAGIYHDDLHLGNILIRTAMDHGGPDGIELYLIDLPRVRVGKPLDWPQSRHNLVMLHSDWGRHVSRTERWRFWRAYLAARPELQLGDPRSPAADLTARSRCYALRLARSRDKRALRTNRSFLAQRCQRGTLWSIQGLPPEVGEMLLAGPEAWLRLAGHRIVKLSHRSIVVRVDLTPSSGSCQAAFKRYRTPSLVKRLLSMVRESRARRAWRMGHALLARGIATPRPLAAFEPRAPLALGESYLAAEWLPGAMNLHEYLWQLAELPAAQRAPQCRLLATALGRLLAKLHWWNASHADLKACNILVADGQGDVQTALVDVESVRFYRHLSLARRARDLARLAASLQAHPWVTRTDRLRFLRAYVGGLPATAQRDWRNHWRLIRSLASHIVRRFARRGQIVA
jgi:tRNA A-37 threonylcarbamoyl transferase component Bud32